MNESLDTKCARSSANDGPGLAGRGSDLATATDCRSREGDANSTAEEETNKRLLVRFEEALSSGDWRLISETIDELVAPDARISTPLPIKETGAALLKEVFARLHRAFPDFQITIKDLIAEGDKVVARDTVTGTHQGEYMGIPSTGRKITYDEIFICRFESGRIAETWGVVDVLSQLRQLGALQAASH